MTENVVGTDLVSVLYAKKQSKLFSEDAGPQKTGVGEFILRLLGWILAKPLYFISSILNGVLGFEKMLLSLRVDMMQFFYWGRSNSFAVFAQAILLFVLGILGFTFIIGNVGSKVAQQYGVTSVEPVYATAENDVIVESGSLTTLLPQELKRIETTNYVVTYADTQQKDTLGSIAEKWDITADSIRWANNFSKTYKPEAGKVIKIPPISGSYYTVQSGENLEIIAARFKLDQATIAEINFLSEPYALKQGQEILLPGYYYTPPKPKTTAKKPSGFNTTGGSGTYTAAPRVPTFLEWPVLGGNGGDISRCYTGYYHDGIDITPIGTGSNNPTILASASGKVTYAGVHCSPMPYRYVCGGFAWVVEIDHLNGFSTIYGHLQQNSIMVRAGDAVTYRQPIGKMGNTGTVYGNPGTHLHFQVNHGGFLGKSSLRPTNPAYYLFNTHGCR